MWVDQRRHNLPPTNEIAIIIPDEYQPPSHRDIILAQRNPTNASGKNIICLLGIGRLGHCWHIHMRDARETAANQRGQIILAIFQP